MIQYLRVQQGLLPTMVDYYHDSLSDCLCDKVAVQCLEFFQDIGCLPAIKRSGIAISLFFAILDHYVKISWKTGF